MITCSICNGEHGPPPGGHDGPCRQVVNAGATVQFWGSTDAMFALIRDILQSDMPVRGCLDRHESGGVTAWLWPENRTERELAERHWPGCTVLANEFAKQRSDAQAVPN